MLTLVAQSVPTERRWHRFAIFAFLAAMFVFAGHEIAKENRSTHALPAPQRETAERGQQEARESAGLGP
jgi:hypothetical protein